MLRRRRPWWAMLAAATLVTATLLAPIEGAAYRITRGGDPVDRGDPDNPGGTRTKPPEALRIGIADLGTTFVLQLLPGVTVRIEIPVSCIQLPRWKGRQTR